MRIFAKSLLAATFFLALAQPTRAENLYGEWQGQRYDLYLDNENIYGSYGDARADFYVRDENLYGDLFGSSFDVYVRQENAYGTMPCGPLDYYYRGRNVYGQYCDNRFDVYFNTDDEALAGASDVLLDDIVSAFPQPVRRRVREFILENLTYF